MLFVFCHTDDFLDNLRICTSLTSACQGEPPLPRQTAGLLGTYLGTSIILVGWVILLVAVNAVRARGIRSGWIERYGRFGRSTGSAVIVVTVMV